MYTNQLKHTPHPKANDHGSALILAVVVLAMMMVMGLAFLSIGRMDRISGKASAQAARGDAAVKATVDYLGNVIAKDFTDYLNAATPAEQAARYMTYPDANANNYHPWLASTEPIDTTNPLTPTAWNQWSQSTMLSMNDGYIVSAANLKNSGTNATWHTGMFFTTNEMFTTNNTYLGYSDTMVDADGDGYTDSRWMQLHIPDFDGLTWIAGVRVVDESSCINVNTATEIEEALASSSNKLDGYSPADVNLKRFLGSAVMTSFNGSGFEFSSSTTAWPTLNAQTTIGYNTTTGVSAASGNFAALLNKIYPSPAYAVPVSATTRETSYWAKSANLDSPPAGYYPIPQSALAKLRSHYGTNGRSWSPLESALDASNNGVLRANRDERTLSATSGVPDGNGFPLTIAQLMADRRHLLTTYNGARQLRPRWATTVTGTSLVTTAGSGDHKLDPNDTNVNAGTEYAQAIEKVLKQDPTNYYEGDAAHSTSAAYSLAANMLSYRSTELYDISQAKVSNATNDYYGLMHQPFIAEAVTMIVYKDANNNSSIDPTDPLEVVGKRILVELHNPWPIAIDLSKFAISVDSSAPEQLSAVSIPAGDYVVLYSNNDATLLTWLQTAIASGGGGFDTPAEAAKLVPINTFTYTDTLGAGIIELKYYNTGTPANSLTVDRLRATGGNWPAQPLAVATPVTTAGATYIVSSSTKRWWGATTDTGVATAPVRPAAMPAFVYENSGKSGVANAGETNNTYTTPNVISHTLKQAPKAALPVTPLPITQLPYKNANFDTVGEIGNLFTVSHVYATSTLVNTFSELLYTRYLETSSSGQPDTAKLRLTEFVRTTDPKLPVATSVFDQFSILPGSSTNNQMVYGQININTAPASVLHMLPYMLGGNPVTTTAPHLGTGLVGYREKQIVVSGANGISFVDRSHATLATAIAGLRTDLGFAANGELMLVRRFAAETTPTADDTDYLMTRLALGAGTASSPTIGDFTNDALTKDIEKEELQFTRISNLVTVRSDVFTAYVLLQGRKYETDPADNTLKWMPKITRRFVVTFDRSNVDGSGTAGHTSPRVVMFTEDR